MHPGHVRHAAELGEGEQLLSVETLDQVVPSAAERVGDVGGIAVHPDNVHISIPRIPLGFDAVVYPDQVVQAMMLGKPLEHDPPELDVSIRPLGPPPEPTSLGLVHRPPEDRHAGVGELLELYGDGIDVANQQLVVLRVRVGKGFAYVKCGALGIEAAPPRLLFGVQEVLWGIPMPAHRDDEPLAGGLDHLLHVVLGIGAVSLSGG